MLSSDSHESWLAGSVGMKASWWECFQGRREIRKDIPGGGGECKTRNGGVGEVRAGLSPPVEKGRGAVKGTLGRDKGSCMVKEGVNSPGGTGRGP